jgi:hypothetical protein
LAAAKPGRASEYPRSGIMHDIVKSSPAGQVRYVTPAPGEASVRQSQRTIDCLVAAVNDLSPPNAPLQGRARWSDALDSRA